MRPTAISRILRRALALAAVLTLAAGFTGLMSSPAQAAAWLCHSGFRDDNGDANSRDIDAVCYTAGSTDDNEVYADFRALGEHFIVCDHFPNGHATFAQLTVEGNGTATFYTAGGGDPCDDFNLSYSEGLSVSLKVCTSDTAGATCTRATGGIT
ncbi:hypothetical protein [Glycomyces harbinensis]|uniref:Secreted protein n=1 Tax=Glycomyces harbinensis TaxID=58114 RepID=A0A1G6VNF0_9ACTN|nr:hypothetical protein [Glycomyces harbinensis]SDD54405.1 hypothetical protein SAMN05216270_10510 [Glycomyces harbinensis]